jgi:hypothetical protein
VEKWECGKWTDSAKRASRESFSRPMTRRAVRRRFHEGCYTAALLKPPFDPRCSLQWRNEWPNALLGFFWSLTSPEPFQHLRLRFPYYQSDYAPSITRKLRLLLSIVECCCFPLRSEHGRHGGVHSIGVCMLK